MHIDAGIDSLTKLQELTSRVFYFSTKSAKSTLVGIAAPRKTISSNTAAAANEDRFRMGMFIACFF